MHEWLLISVSYSLPLLSSALVELHKPEQAVQEVISTKGVCGQRERSNKIGSSSVGWTRKYRTTSIIGFQFLHQLELKKICSFKNEKGNFLHVKAGQWELCQTTPRSCKLVIARVQAKSGGQ